jgi:general secretion pathway protein J
MIVMMRLSQQGMTLLEVLIALAIFALIAAAGYSGLQQGLSVQDALQQLQVHWQRLDAVMNLIQQDMDQARDVAPRLPAWETLAFRGSADGERAGEPGELLLFTRAGHTFLESGQNSPYLRLTYRFEDGTLYRDVRPRLNTVTEVQSAKAELLHDVAGVQLRYLDRRGQWLPDWPQALNLEQPAGLPRAVELTLQLNDRESYQRVFHVGTVN